jgi:hypothetical protein
VALLRPHLQPVLTATPAHLHIPHCTRTLAQSSTGRQPWAAVNRRQALLPLVVVTLSARARSPGYSIKPVCFLRVGPVRRLTNSALVALPLLLRTERFTYLLHCSCRPVRIPDKYREQSHCTLGPLSYRIADVKLFETIF